MRVGGQGLQLRSVKHLGSSMAENPIDTKKVKCDGRTDREGQTVEWTDGLTKWGVVATKK